MSEVSNTLVANEILNAIEQAKLTDDEVFLLPEGDSKEAMFESLALILNERSAEGLAIEKLVAYALLNGVRLNAKKEFKSNVFVGAVIE